MMAPMIKLRPLRSLFHAEGGWFSANWHFSFDQYWDPEWMGLGALRVFNDDRLIAGAAWPMHPHRDVEGITYVAEGEFEHADSLRHNGVLHAGGVQRMTLGRGAEHSERNHSKSAPMRFIQLWIIPARRGLEPAVEQREFPVAERRNRFRAVLVPAQGFAGDGAPRDDGAVRVHQDAALYAGAFEAGVTARQSIRPGFGGYLFVVHGSATLANAGPMEEGSAAVILEEQSVSVSAGAGGAELLLVETPL